MKKTVAKKKFKNTWKLSLVLAALAFVIGFMSYQKLSVPAQVSFIGSSGDQCHSNLVNITTGAECKTGFYSQASANCRIPGNISQRSIELVESGQCVSRDTIELKASAACGVTCTMAPPRPSPKSDVCSMEVITCTDGSVVGRTGPNCEFACPTKKSVSNTCTPRPACLDATPACMIKMVEGTVWCDSIPKSPTPSPKPSLFPSPSIVPSPSPNLSGIMSFRIAKSCGMTSFLSISFDCKDGRKKELATNTCTDLVSAYAEAQSVCAQGVK